MKNKYSFLAEVEELLNQVLGYPKGTLALNELCEKHAGTNCYIPSQTEIYIAYRNEQIRIRFRGDNYVELAIASGLSISQVRRIIDKQ